MFRCHSQRREFGALEPDVALDRREASFLTVAPNVAGVTSPDPTIAQVSFRKHMVVARKLATLPH